MYLLRGQPLKDPCLLQLQVQQALQISAPVKGARTVALVCEWKGGGNVTVWKRLQENIVR